MFFTYIKFSEYSSAQCYQDNNERLQNKFVKDIKVFQKKKKKKEDEKQKLIEYRKKYYSLRKKRFTIII